MPVQSGQLESRRLSGLWLHQQEATTGHQFERVKPSAQALLVLEGLQGGALARLDIDFQDPINTGHLVVTPTPGTHEATTADADTQYPRLSAQAKWLLGEDYVTLLGEPIDAARQRLRLGLPERYFALDGAPRTIGAVMAPA